MHRVSYKNLDSLVLMIKRGFFHSYQLPFSYSSDFLGSGAAIRTSSGNAGDVVRGVTVLLQLHKDMHTMPTTQQDHSASGIAHTFGAETSTSEHNCRNIAITLIDPVLANKRKL